MTRYGINHSTRSLGKSVAEMLMQVNEGITSGDLLKAKNMLTEAQSTNLLNTGQIFPSAGAGFARITGVAQEPEMLMSRVMHLSKTIMFAQATYLVRTFQTPVTPFEHPFRRGVKVDDFRPPVPDPNTRWIPAHDAQGRMYFYRNTSPSPLVVWKIPDLLRLKPIAYSKSFGTLGETGKWISDSTVENIVTIERPLHRRDVGWRIHRF